MRGVVVSPISLPAWPISHPAPLATQLVTPFITSSPAALIGAVMMSLTAPPGFVTSFGTAPTTDFPALHPAFSGFGTNGIDGIEPHTSARAGVASTSPKPTNATIARQAMRAVRSRRMSHPVEPAEAGQEVAGRGRRVARSERWRRTVG